MKIERALRQAVSPCELRDQSKSLEAVTLPGGGFCFSQ